MTYTDFSDIRPRMSGIHWEDNSEEEAMTLAPTVIADATPENIEKAKEHINGLTANGGNVTVCCGGIAL